MDEKKYKGKTKGKGLSDREFQEKINTYQKFTTEPEQGLKLEEARKKYKTEISKSQDIQSKQEIYHGLGERKGLSPTPLENIKDVHEHLRQKYRDEISLEADNYYDKNLSLKKNFSKLNGQEKSENKEIDFEK